MRTIIRILTAFLVTLLMDCGTESILSLSTSGSGTQTTNGFCISSTQKILTGHAFTLLNDSTQERLTGHVLDVQIFSECFQPYNNQGYHNAFQLDSQGGLSIDSLTEGFYNIFVTDSINSTMLLFQSVPVFDSTNQYEKKLHFLASGTISGVLSDTSLLTVQNDSIFAGIFILGTPFFSVVDSSGSFSFPHVPVGLYMVNTGYFNRSRPPASGFSPLIFWGPVNGRGGGGDTVDVTVESDSISVLNLKL